jgi:hypothetical protein
LAALRSLTQGLREIPWFFDPKTHFFSYLSV